MNLAQSHAGKLLMMLTGYKPVSLFIKHPFLDYPDLGSYFQTSHCCLLCCSDWRARQ